LKIIKTFDNYGKMMGEIEKRHDLEISISKKSPVSRNLISFFSKILHLGWKSWRLKN